MIRNLRELFDYDFVAMILVTLNIIFGLWHIGWFSIVSIGSAIWLWYMTNKEYTRVKELRERNDDILHQ